MSQEVLGSCVSLQQSHSLFWIARKSIAPAANAARMTWTSVTTILKVGRLPVVGTVARLLMSCSIATCSSIYNFLIKLFCSLVTGGNNTVSNLGKCTLCVRRCLPLCCSVKCVVIVHSHALDLPFLRPFMVSRL
jgi:hypothetical protein